MEVSPKFTVITICYNGEKTIQSTIESVNDQSVKSIQHLIIDGASSDSTLDICEKFKHKYTEIISEPDDGIYFAMNKGLAAARGEIICFLNADDFYVNSTVLEKVETTFNLNPKSNYCYGDICYVGAMDHEKIIRYWKSKENAAANLKEGWIPPHPAFFIKSELLQKLGNFNVNYKFAADFDFILRCLLSKHGQGIYIPLAMVYMRVGGLTNKNFRNVVLQNIEIMRILRSHNLGFSRLIFMFKKFVIRLKQRCNVLS